VCVFPAFSIYAALGVCVTAFHVGFIPDVSGQSLEGSAAATQAVTP
jgi:hypothetical protein